MKTIPNNIYTLESSLRNDTIRNGGCTFFFNRAVESGRSKLPYIVGLGLDGFKIDSETLYRGSFATILEGYIEVWRGSEVYFDGFRAWVNPDTDLTEIDPIRVYSNLKQALEIAKASNEKCIFNTETNETVNV